MTERNGEERPLAAVVLAAGDSTRMRTELPKVLHEVNFRPLIAHVVAAAREACAERAVVVVGYRSDLVRKELGDSVDYAEQRELLGTGDAVRQALPLLEGFEGDLLVLCGDAPLIRSETLRGVVQRHREGSLACTVLTAELEDPRGYGRILKGADGSIGAIREERDCSEEERRVREVNSGAYCFRPGALRDALARVRDDNDQGEYYLTDVVEILLRNGRPVGAFRAPSGEEIFGINTRAELALAERAFQRRVNALLMEEGVTLVDPETAWIDSRARIGADTVVHPFTVIEGEVEIGRRCEVGPFSHVRTGSVMEEGSALGNFVEMKKSTLGRGSKAKHLSYLGDAAVGRRVNIGAGTITANYDGKAKHRTVIEDGAFIGSGTTLVAPVRVGKEAVTGAGAVVIRGRDVPDRAVVVGIPAREIKRKTGGEDGKGCDSGQAEGGERK